MPSEPKYRPPFGDNTVLSVEDALAGWGNSVNRARVLAIEVEKLRAQLEECHKFRATLISNIANRNIQSNDH